MRPSEDDALHTSTFARRALQIATPLAIVMGASDILQHRWAPAVCEALLATVATVLALGAKGERFDPWRRRLAGAFILFVYTMYAWDGPERVVHLVWIPLFPIAVVLVATKAEANFFTGAMTLGQVAIYVGYRLQHGRWSIAPEIFVETIVVFAGATGLSVVFERIMSKQVRRLKQLAETDPLTGVANRRRFYDLLQAESARAARYGHPWSVLSIDIDHFKAVNDTHGHDAGDRVLRATAQHLSSLIREGDLVARVGGEEFAILTPETAASGAAALADRLRSGIAASEVPGIGNVTCSLGVAQATPGEDVDAVLRRADVALYRAKSGGRNRVVVEAHPSLRESAVG